MGLASVQLYKTRMAYARKRPSIHASSGSSCRRRSFWRKNSPLEDRRDKILKEPKIK